jgi:hypothetical protein
VVKGLSRVTRACHLLAKVLPIDRIDRHAGLDAGERSRSRSVDASNHQVSADRR